jgi:Ferritin-like
MGKGSLPRKGWTPARVREHLQNAVYLEMWTVPLYLTAAYSLDAPVSKKTHRPEFASVPMKDARPDFAKFEQKDFNQYAFNNILSVAIQEMLHVELAANVLNAVRPKEDASPVTFTGKGRDPKPPKSAPQYDSTPACLGDAKLPSGVSLRLGPFDLNQARLFQWVETDQKLPPKPYDVEEWHAAYNSIGHFYTSLMYGVKACWEDLYPKEGRAQDPYQRDDWETAAKGVQGGRLLKAIFAQATSQGDDASKGGGPSKLLQQVAYKDFSIKIYGSQEEARVRAEAAMTAITVQGEGAGGSQEIPKKFRPTGDPEDDIEIALDRVSHYERFTELAGFAKEKRFSFVRPIESPDPSLYSVVLNQSFSSFLMSLNDAFSNKGDMSIGAMAGLGNRTLQAWQNNVPAGQMYRWESPDKYEDPDGRKGYHACQGLDASTHGANAACALMADGKTASAFYHTCATTNMCKAQGGCGLAVAKPPDPRNWKPSQNDCKGQGGCGVPIPDAQVYNANPAQNMGGVAPTDLQNKSVWEHAREVLKYTTPMRPSGERESLTPTSPVYKEKKPSG